MFPDFPRETIELDLSRSGSVQATCDNILNGLLVAPPPPRAASASSNSSSGKSSLLQSVRDFDALPSEEPSKQWLDSAKDRESQLRQRKLFMLNQQREKFLKKGKNVATE
ncbi:MAG: hypothetical protein SGCHY_000693 [Lobulomycetales sp.]